MWKEVPGIGACPFVVSLNGLIDFTSHRAKIKSLNGIALSLGYAIAQIVGLLDILPGQARLVQVAVARAQSGVGDCEVRIQFASSFHVWKRGGVALFHLNSSPFGVLLQSVQR